MAKGVRGSGGKCGEYSGWNKHRREGTPICDACREAARRYRARWRLEHPEAAARAVRNNKAASRARSAALSTLSRRHRDEYRYLYQAALMKELKAMEDAA